jgi:hypothetical protein
MSFQTWIVCYWWRTGYTAWEDAWLGRTPLAVQYPYLYNIVRHKNITAAETLKQTPWNIWFMRV